MNGPKTDVLLRALSIAVLLALLSLWPSQFNRQIDKYSSYFLHNLRGPRSPQIEPLFIFLDSKDIADFGGWPITRDYYGYLAHALDSVGAGTVVIDILFPRMAHYDPGLDEATAGIFRAAGNIILPNVFDEILFPDQQIPQAFSATFPAPLYQEAASAIGFANMGGRAFDGAIPLVVQFDGENSYSLGVHAAAQHLNATVMASPGSDLMLVDKVSSEVLSSWGNTLLPNYWGGVEDVPQIGFVQFLQDYPQLADSIDFTNKLIIVGLTAPGLPVLTSNPFEDSYPASLVHLTVAENLITGTGLSKMPVWYEWMSWLLLSFFGIWMLARRWDWISTTAALSIILAILFFSYFAFCYLFYLTPLIYHLLYLFIIMVVAGVWSIRLSSIEQNIAAENLRSRINEKTSSLHQTQAALDDLTVKMSLASGHHEQLQEDIEAHQKRVATLESQLKDLQAGELTSTAVATAFTGIIHSVDGKMAKLLQLVQRVAKEDIPVLISGETGTGKELIANAIHQKSARHRQAFVAVNCGAITDTLLESELFGHEKGSFTGAHTRRKGRFELADGGTIFLDEITETSAAFQARLLRVLQEGTFERLGGEQAIRVDVRVVAATNRNIEDEIRAGNFREDLYYRLNGFPLSLPALRERGDDILLLCGFILEKQTKDVSGFSQEAIELLQKYKWPGNVRELENVVRRAAILAESEGRKIIRVSDLPEEIQAPVGSVQKEFIDLDSQILEHLRSHDFSRSAITRTARALDNRDRGTITEYFRGMCFQALVQNDFEVGAAVWELVGRGGTEAAVERVRIKIERYLQNLEPLPDVNAEDFDPRQYSVFRGLPAGYHPSLIAVIRHLREA